MQSARRRLSRSSGQLFDDKDDGLGLRPARQRSDGHGAGRRGKVADLDHRVRERGCEDHVADELGGTRGLADSARRAVAPVLPAAPVLPVWPVAPRSEPTKGV